MNLDCRGHFLSFGGWKVLHAFMGWLLGWNFLEKFSVFKPLCLLTHVLRFCLTQVLMITYENFTQDGNRPYRHQSRSGQNLETMGTHLQWYHSGLQDNASLLRLSKTWMSGEMRERHPWNNAVQHHLHLEKHGLASFETISMQTDMWVRFCNQR